MSELGFRRRCGWCGVQLRGWQLNLCRTCRRHASDAGIYLQSGGPPCKQGSRWRVWPDEFEWPWPLREVWRAERWR